MPAGLGLVRSARRRAGGMKRNAYAVTSGRDAEMLPLARIADGPVDGQVAVFLS